MYLNIVRKRDNGVIVYSVPANKRVELSNDEIKVFAVVDDVDSEILESAVLYPNASIELEVLNNYIYEDKKFKKVA